MYTIIYTNHNYCTNNIYHNIYHNYWSYQPTERYLRGPTLYRGFEKGNWDGFTTDVFSKGKLKRKIWGNAYILDAESKFETVSDFLRGLVLRYVW